MKENIKQARAVVDHLKELTAAGYLDYEQLKRAAYDQLFGPEGCIREYEFLAEDFLRSPDGDCRQLLEQLDLCVHCFESSRGWF